MTTTTLLEDTAYMLNRAYVELLTYGWSQRLKPEGQQLLCDMRDVIARATGSEPQAVQDLAEFEASKRRQIVSSPATGPSI